MKHKPMPSMARILELLEYRRSTGVFTWRVASSNRMPTGSVAGTVMNAGYVHIQIDNVLYLAHRVAWFITTGVDPGLAQIDHRNRVRTDNRKRNLRLALGCETDNLQNSSVRSNNSSGHPGVCRTPNGMRWRAYVSRNRKQINLGSFKTKAEAIAARKVGKAIHHKFQPKDRP